MSTFRDKVTLLIGTCDKYSFLWQDFSFLFRKYWDDRLDIRKVFMSETASEDIDGFEFLTPGKIPYTDALKYSLERIDTPYVLWMQEDYMMQNTIPLEYFEYYMDFVESNDADRFAIDDKHNSEYRLELTSNNVLHNGNHIFKMRMDSNFIVSMQPSIWKREYFMQCLSSGESPWQFEKYGTERARHFNSSTYINIDTVSNGWIFQGMIEGQMTARYIEYKTQKKI